MKILLLSDTHGKHRELTDMPPADILVHSGDFTLSGGDMEAQKRKKATEFVDSIAFRTAYQSRTGDLLRERQLSWTTRRMRLILGRFLFRNRVQKYNFFPTWQTFFRIFFIFFHDNISINYLQ